MISFSRRILLLGGGAAIGGWATHRYGPAIPSLDGTRSLKPPTAPQTLNDASGLSETPIFRHAILKQKPGKALVHAIRAEISDARANGLPVNIGAARHSMGAQAIPHLGHAITLDNGHIEIDTAGRTYRAHAGVRWHQVIAKLDRLGFGPKVMQSNNDFGLAATFCVNAHGWPVKLGPMGATVRSFDMVLPDGELITCSRSENPQIFAMTMGGYGLTGAITTIEAEMAPNARLEPQFQEMPSEEFGTKFIDKLSDGTVKMAYGRLNVDRANFFDHALMITYSESENQTDLPPASGSGLAAHLASRVYRWQLGNERLKRLRWWSETDLAPALAGGAVTRNSLINEPVVTLDDRNPNRTDILHEYFVPPHRFADFITLCKQEIPASYQEFLNVTLRYVDADTDSWLAYAPASRIAAVMSFSQEMTARAEADMTRLTRALIDGVLGIGGSYYLPYRPHATLEQMARAYPRASEFATFKRALDPSLTFRNNLWDTYLNQL